MMIKHIDQSTLSTPSLHILLKHVLHVPQATHNLASIHHLTSDNDVFLEFHPKNFLIKHQHTRRTLLHGRCRNGLYPIPSLELPSDTMCLSAIKPSSE
jgi:hypothetical protein